MIEPLVQKKKDVQDEDLIQQMNEIVLEEVANKLKLGSSSRHKNPNVNEVHVLQKEKLSAQPETADNKMQNIERGSAKEDVMAAPQEVRSELATL